MNNCTITACIFCLLVDKTTSGNNIDMQNNIGTTKTLRCGVR